MDAGSINETLLKGLQQAQFERVAALSKVLGLKIGGEIMASVQKITDASPDERAAILKQIDETLTQLNKNSAAPAVKNLISQLLSQQQLIQSPHVKLVALQLLGNNFANDLLLTYTDKPLTQGQQLLLRLVDNQRLVMLDTNAITNPANSTGATAASTTTSSSISDLSKLTALLNAAGYAKESEASQPPPSNNLLNQKIYTDAVSNALRTLLPQKDKGQDVLTALPKITQFIQQLSVNERQQWLSSNVQQALKTVADHLRQPAQLTNPKLLAMIVNNSGTQFEKKIAQYLPTTSGETTTNGKLLNITGKSPNLTPNNALLNTNKPSLEHIAKQDLKGALLGLLNEIDKEVATISSTTTTPITEVNKPTSNNLMLLLGELLAKKTPELSQKVLRAQLAMLIQQHTLGSLAKIQLQQIHTLSNQRTQADPTGPQQSWQAEIPVRHGNDVHPLHMQFEQHWVEENPENTEEKKSIRVKQWNVMLTFQLPVVGQFFAQLTLVGNSLSAKLWAEQQETLDEAKTKMDELKNNLEQQGIQVKQIQCLPGIPPQPKMSFSYSLVDVQT